MAEVVNNKCEKMHPELEALVRTGLLKEEYAKRVTTMRTHLEYKTNGSGPKNIENYRMYIESEILLLEKIQKTRDKKKISENRVSIDNSIIKRISKLFENALLMPTSDLALHKKFVTFCKKHGFNGKAWKAIENITTKYVGQEEAWDFAAESYCYRDINRAREFLRKGLTHHPASRMLYTRAIQMELDQLLSLNSQGDKLFEINQCCANIRVYVDLILTNMKDLDYVLSVLEKIQKHTTTSEAQGLILDYLFVNHSGNDLVWHTLAERERKGMHFKTDPNEKPRSGSFTKSCILYCVEKYKQGLLKVSEDKKRNLWSHYLDTLIEINKENHSSATESRKGFLIEALEEAHTSRYLEDRHYGAWVEIISDDEAWEILERATDMYPESEALWKLRLKYAIKSDKVAMVNAIFKQGVIELKEKALSLWLMVLRFHLLVSDNNKMKSIFEDGLKQPPEVANVLKPKYIEWLTFHEGMAAGRTKYRILAAQQPYCKELHLLMSKLESTELTIDDASWRYVHELACEQFPEDVDVWESYAKFVLFRKPVDFRILAEKIRKDAKEKLPPHLHENFDERYQSLLDKS